MHKKSIFFIFVFLISTLSLAQTCKPPINWATPNALKNYELCQKKHKEMPQTKTAALKPEAKDACTVLSDGSYRCKPNELRFFEKPERAFALPEKQNPQSEADGAATLAIPPPPPATPTPQN